MVERRIAVVVKFEEQVRVIDRDDGRIKIAYWNPSNGETQIMCSRRAAVQIQRQLRKVIDGD